MTQAVLKLLLLLVLAVAVPAQGISAVTARFCMAMGHHQGQAADAPHAHATPDHDHAGMEASQPESTEKPASYHNQAGSAHCPPCASCCATTAISPTPPHGLPDAPPAAANTVLHGAAARFLPEQLDRPPLAL